MSEVDTTVDNEVSEHEALGEANEQSNETAPIVFEKKLEAKIEYIPELDIGRVFPNSWNPNKMSDKAFNKLSKEIDESGFLEPIQVVPKSDGTYMILGGEHRYRVVKAKGFTTIPAVVLKDEKYQGDSVKATDALKFITMRLNVLRGRVDPSKFMSYYTDLVSRHDEAFMQDLMGVMEDDAWSKLLKQSKVDVKNAINDVGDPELKKKMLQEFDKVSDQIKTVDDLSNVLNKIFTSCGSTLDQGYMVFSYGGAEHIYVQLQNKKDFTFIHEKLFALQQQGLHVGDVIKDLFGGYIPSESMPKGEVSTEIPKPIEDLSPPTEPADR